MLLFSIAIVFWLFYILLAMLSFYLMSLLLLVVMMLTVAMVVVPIVDSYDFYMKSRHFQLGIQSHKCDTNFLYHYLFSVIYYHFF